MNDDKHAATTPGEAIISIESAPGPRPIEELIEALHARRDERNNPSGIVHWSPFAPYKIAEHDGVEVRGVCDPPAWRELYGEIARGRRPDVAGVSPEALEEKLAAVRAGSAVPIAVAHFLYETPRRPFVARVIADARAQRATAVPEEASRVLQSKRAFFACGMLEQRYLAFEPLPPIHYGREVTFVLPREAFLTNVPGEPAKIEIDFDDDRGYRAVRFDEPIQITYDEHVVSHLRVRVEHGGVELVSTFRFETTAAAPPPDETWPLTAVETYAGRGKATGTAWVYYAKGRSRIEEPLVFADGFGPGKTDLNEVWRQFNETGVRFADQLRARGKDLIIVGYDDKAAYIQENAFVAVDCIRKAIAKRTGAKPLVTGGASMGGLVTRYALAWMERRGADHQTATYLSYDTPHNGAWLPLIVQYFVHYYRNYNGAAKEFSNLVNSPAAQQLLWGHIGSWNQEGPVNQNPLRLKMLEELRALGWFPSRPVKLGVANGRGNGAGNGVPTGASSVKFSYACYGSDLLTMPPFSLGSQRIGSMWVAGYGETTYSATSIAAFDSAPGGTTDFFKRVGDAVGVKPEHPTTCFIPSLSALAIKPEYSQNIYENIAALPRVASNLDDYAWSSTRNGGHVEVTQELVEWILARLQPRDAVAAPARKEGGVIEAEPVGA
jgi:hypothetical protein